MTSNSVYRFNRNTSLIKASILIRGFFFIGLFANNVSLAFAENSGFIKNDLEKFKETHQCLHCDLSQAELAGDFSKASLDASNLNNIVMDGNITDISVRNSLAIGASFKSIESTHIHFENSNVSYSRFTSNFPYCQFIHTSLRFASFKETILTGCDFTGSDLSGASFELADLSFATISKEQLAQAANLCDAILPDGTLGSCPNTP